GVRLRLPGSRGVGRAAEVDVVMAAAAGFLARLRFPVIALRRGIRGARRAVVAARAVAHVLREAHAGEVGIADLVGHAGAYAGQGGAGGVVVDPVDHHLEVDVRATRGRGAAVVAGDAKLRVDAVAVGLQLGVAAVAGGAGSDVSLERHAAAGGDE